MKCSLPVRNTQNFSACPHKKLQFLEKLSPLVHFGCSFSIAWIFGIIYQFIQKDSSKNESRQILICSLLQAKYLVITKEKDERVKMVLSYGLQQKVSVELYTV